MIEAHFHHHTREYQAKKPKTITWWINASSCLISPFLSAASQRYEREYTFSYTIPNSNMIAAASERWRLGGGGSPACARILFLVYIARIRIYCVVSVFFLWLLLLLLWLFLSRCFFLFYRVAPRGVIDSRPRSIDYDYQGRVGVIRDLLSGSDRYGIQLYSGSPHRDKNQTRF